MIQPSVSDSLDRAAFDAGEPRRVSPPLALVADGQSPMRAADERIVATVASSRPSLSWKIAPELGSVGTTAFEVDVRDSAGLPFWTSGILASDATEAVVARELAPHTLYEWRVRVADDGGQWSPWAVSALETGPLAYSDWQARWLSVPHRARVSTPFRLTRPVTRARLYLTAQGLVRARVNGDTINPDRMDPTRTDFVRALFRSYDVTTSLAAGENVLDLVTGLGEWARTGESPRLLAELVVWHDDGSTTRVTPGAASTVTDSEVAIDEPFYLERHDSRALSAAATPLPAPVILDAAATPTSPATPPTDVSSDPTPPLRTVQTFTPTQIGRTAGSRVFDVGVNIAGRSKLVLGQNVPAGTVISVLHGEHVGPDGHIDTTNLTMPYDHGRERQLTQYVTSGVAGEVHEPWFAYYGFRYVEVRGLADDATVSVTAYSMHTELQPSGTLQTDSPTIDRLLAVAARTLLNNVHGVPEDCPTREQAAWTGDTASVAEYELAAFDSARFLDKWIADLETSQQPDGQLPAISPDLHATRMPSDPVWGSALHRMLRGHLLHYGELRLVRRALPALRRWADFQLGCADDDGIISRSPISYGHDWLALEQTPPPIHHTGAVIDCLLALADLEEATGDADAAAHRRASADGLRASARRAFFDPATGTFGNGSQGSYAIAIESGILTGREAQNAGERLVRLVRARGNRVSSGFATTRSVVRALTMLGASQLVYDILRQPEEPGVGAMLNSGPGTFWECWWIDPSNTGTGSLNHVGLGGPFAAWAWEALGGLQPTAPGYAGFRVAPQFVDGVSQLELRTETVRGEVAVGYTRIGSRVRVEITVPPGSECTLALVGRADEILPTGTHVIDVEMATSADSAPSSLPATLSLPSVAPAAADVLGSRTLLAESRVAAGRGDPQIETLEALRCMPVPHEQADHAVLKIVGTAPGISEDAPTVTVTPHAPVPLGGVTFVYALIDQCIEGPERTATPVLLLHLSDGTTLRGSSTGWPAGWNRVAVDTAHLGGDREVTCLEVGLEYGEEPADNALAVYPSENGIRTGFHLGEVGFSTSPRTW